MLIIDTKERPAAPVSINVTYIVLSPSLRGQR
jgi:hypothetical protein